MREGRKARSAPGKASRLQADRFYGEIGSRALLPNVPRARLGGLDIAVLDRTETADLMVDAALGRLGRDRPVIFSSANGEVISRCARDPALARLFEAADLLSADGAPLVFASHLVAGRTLPERVATTDLFHDVARRAEAVGASFYLYGASEEVSLAAYQRTKALYPRLRIVGRSHGYLTGDSLSERVAEIRELGPDILWVALGVPKEQAFYVEWAPVLDTVGAIKTSGGLFDFLAGARRRAPLWIQAMGFEWAYRIAQEPRRLWRRYAVTTPHALYLLITASGSRASEGRSEGGRS
jgi:N-acetylglucosaminyldiphosphoundecaprenol N-acetyl-beta-D-mannosaminyltransferase